MTKKEKIAALKSAMTSSKRDDGTMFNHFTDGAPIELIGLFLKHYEVKDFDYQTFYVAIDMLIDIYDDDVKDIEDAICERSSERASVYTNGRLAYLNANNQDEVSDIMREYTTKDIADACAIWYDKRIEEMAMIINEWVDAK
jgi:hypothetical protein